MEYLGEWIGVAYAGRFLVALAFVSALVATGAFWKGNLHLGRRAYLTHAGSTCLLNTTDAADDAMKVKISVVAGA